MKEIKQLESHTDCNSAGCVHNTGIVKQGKIQYHHGVDFKCMLESPKVINFGDSWGCEDERHPGEAKAK